LIANSIDRASTSCVTVGVFAPGAAAIYTISGTVVSSSIFLIGTVIWLFAAIQLFAFVILPLALAAGGWVIVLLNERHNRR
jgi:hypothetical protein